nr:archaellin/type IV pilin N-terminal domain-containing protein [uncultured Methanolobus sp.]
MKANKQIFIKKDTHAQVGIGTLIIFIAMVLVAAVAAAVLIQTSGTLQQKAQSTGKQATQEVSSNLMIKGIEGVRAKNSLVDMSDTIDLLELKVGLNVGSSPVDVNQVIISITDGTTTNDLAYAGNSKSYGQMSGFNSSSATINLRHLLSGMTNNNEHPKVYFTVEKIRDEDSSFSQSNPVMNTGDLITVYIATISPESDGFAYDYVGSIDPVVMESSDLNLVPRAVVSIVMTPESGAATTAEFVTPSSYGVKETVQLYP